MIVNVTIRKEGEHLTHARRHASHLIFVESKDGSLEVEKARPNSHDIEVGDIFKSARIP